MPSNRKSPASPDAAVGIVGWEGGECGRCGFKDEIDGLPAKLIIATNGGTKNNKREQNSDIQRSILSGYISRLANGQATAMARRRCC